jgi:hypothetical protein
MPVTGRKPKPDGQKRNRHAPTHEWVEVVDRPFDGRVPKLPPRKGGWPAATKRWWATVSRMPHCTLWSDADWQFALDTALIAAAFHEGDVRTATELRQREKILGTTVDARRDLRIRYVDVGDAVQVEPGGDGATVIIPERWQVG